MRSSTFQVPNKNILPRSSEMGGCSGCLLDASF